MPDTIFHRLYAVIEERNRLRPAHSYTTRLLEGGPAATGAKVMEEAAEVVEAAGADPSRRRAAIVHEAADLVYHLWVLLVQGEVTLEELEAELGRRFGTSGLDEKARRT